MNQNSALLSYLQRNEGITQLEAFNALGCCRLSERIRECERLGWTFEHQRVSVPARDGKQAHVVRYKLIAEPDERMRSGEFL